MRQKLKIISLVSFALSMLAMPILAPSAHAASCSSGTIANTYTVTKNGKNVSVTECAPLSKDNNCSSGYSYKRKFTDNTGHVQTDTTCGPLGSDSVNPIWGYLQTIVNTLSAGVGLVVVGTIIVGGVQYIIAGDNPSGVEQAKKRIISGLVALVGFFFAWSILQWLIPGGVFG